MPKNKIARIISEIFNGFLTMILTPVIGVLSSELTTTNKTIYTLTYILIPILPYFLLKKLGTISDYEFTKREERPPYFVTITLLFGIVVLVLKQYQLNQLENIVTNVFFVSTVITAITFLWKISGHMTYSTILFATLIYLFPSPYMLLLFLFTPLIGWSRIVLKKHTLTQVSMGTILPLAISILIYWVF